MLNAVLLIAGLGLGMQSTGIDPAGQEGVAEPQSKVITAEYPVSSLGWVLDEISKESGLRIRPGGEGEKHYLAIKVEDVAVTDLLEQIAYVTESQWEIEDEIWLLRPDEAARAESRQRAVAARKEVILKFLTGAESMGMMPTRVFGFAGQNNVEVFYKAMLHMDLERVAAMNTGDVLYFSDRPNSRQLRLSKEAADELRSVVKSHNETCEALPESHLVSKNQLSHDESLVSHLGILNDYPARAVDLERDKLVITIQRGDMHYRSWIDSIYSFHIGFYDSEGELLYGAQGQMHPSQELASAHVVRNLREVEGLYTRLSRKIQSDLSRYSLKENGDIASNEVLELRIRPAVNAIQKVSEKNLVANISDNAFNLGLPYRRPEDGPISFYQAYQTLFAHQMIEEQGEFLLMYPHDSHGARISRLDRRIVARLNSLDSVGTNLALNVMAEIALENQYLPHLLLNSLIRPSEVADALLFNQYWLAFYGSLNHIQRSLVWNGHSLNAGSLSPRSKEQLIRIVDNGRFNQARMDLTKYNLSPLSEAFINWRSTRSANLSSWNASEKLPNGVSATSMIYVDLISRPSAYLREPHANGDGYFYSQFDVPSIADQLHRDDRKEAGHGHLGMDRSESSFVAGNVQVANLIFEVAPTCVVFGRLVAGEPDIFGEAFSWQDMPPRLVDQARNFMAHFSRFSRDYDMPAGRPNSSPPVQIVPPPAEVR